MTAATLPLVAERNQPFLDTVEFRGLDLTGGTFKMELRQYRGLAAVGSPILALANATAGSQGLSVAVSVDGAGMPTSVLTIQIDKSTIDAIQPFTVTAGVPNRSVGKIDLTLAYDLKIAATGIPEQRAVEGSFTIHEGVTP